MAVIGAILTGLGMALALVQPASARPNCDVPNPPPICDPTEPPDDPTPATYVPVLAFDGAQQTTSRTGVHIWGWTADDDLPATSLTVRITIDGASATTLTANQSRPDVAAAYPKYGAAHGFDLVLPASAAGHNICVAAVSVGGGADKTVCRQMDDIVDFVAYNISYDIAHAVLTGASLEQLDKVTNRNDTTLQQSTEISGSRTATDSEGWSDTVGIKVTVSTGFKTGIPILAEGKITVTAEGTYSYTQNGSHQRAQTFSWRQPVLVPARSIVEATVTITHSTISVPYTLTGEFVYRSGARAAGSVNGMFSGGNSENLSVNLKQYNLDGTPAAAPASQSPAAMLKVTQAR
ncbi:ETX/MTX2 family pore-forming toxin [Micromonospora sp. NPDC048999]|uniref:ETX/MTX2 family pore-forming toxin n=1 Tax=Micromonospora sp. NPDC048999 TaxID=3155391 RepID=UPI0033F91C78